MLHNGCKQVEFVSSVCHAFESEPSFDMVHSKVSVDAADLLYHLISDTEAVTGSFDSRVFFDNVITIIT